MWRDDAGRIDYAPQRWRQEALDLRDDAAGEGAPEAVAHRSSGLLTGHSKHSARNDVYQHIAGHLLGERRDR